MNKKWLFLGLSLAPLAMAHGPLSQQGSDAVKAATTLFQKSIPAETTKRFHTVSATLTGHEQFQVVIQAGTNPTTKLTYDCRENELVDPVKWECKVIQVDEE